MEKQNQEEFLDSAPSYEESIAAYPTTEKAAASSFNSVTLQDRIAEVRRQRVKLLVDGHIEPLIENAILHGSNQIIIIVPSDALSAPEFLTPTNLVHRPKASATNIIQLQDSNGIAAFWTQPKVIEELEVVIRHMLHAITGTLQATEVLPPRPVDLSSPITGQKSWFKKTFGMPSPEHDPTGSTGQWNLGWRSKDEKPQRKHFPNQHLVSVGVKETAFRTETELGLLSTTTTKCIEIELDFGGL